MRKLLLVVLVFPIFVYADAVYEKEAAIRACTQLVTDYAYHRDRAEADHVAALFTEDAPFTLFGNTFAGREAIRQRVAAGKGGPVFRHMMSTTKIILDESGERATGVAYVAVYQGSAEATPQSVPVEPAIGEYHDKFVKTEEGWKIEERNFVPVFLNPPAN